MICLLYTSIKLIKKLLDLIFFKNIQSPCYYINSNNLLPQPLEEEEETRLLLLVKDGDIEARNTLIEHNLRSVSYTHLQVMHGI